MFNKYFKIRAVYPFSKSYCHNHPHDTYDFRLTMTWKEPQDGRLGFILLSTSNYFLFLLSLLLRNRTKAYVSINRSHRHPSLDHLYPHVSIVHTPHPHKHLM